MKGTQEGEMSAIEDPHSSSPVEVQDPFPLGWRYVRRTLPDGGEELEQVPLTEEDVLHPQEGDFIVRSPIHNEDWDYLGSVLERALAGRPGAVTLHHCRVDFGVKGVEPLGPDLSVFFDVPEDWDRQSATFEVAKYAARPVLVIEVTWPLTRDLKLGPKVTEYERAGVPLYIIVDELPDEGERRLHLFAYRASPGGYVRVEANEQGRLWLDSVRLWLGSEGGQVVCYNEEGQRMPTSLELAQQWAESEARRTRATRLRALAIDLSVSRAKIELELHKARAEAEHARAEAEARARQEMQAQFRRLQDELSRLLAEG
jgi:colicin import membrane protein